MPHLKELKNRRAASPLRFDLLRVTGRAAQGCSTFGEGETRRFAIVRVLDCYRDAILDTIQDFRSKLGMKL